MGDGADTDGKALQARIDDLLQSGRTVYQPLYNYPHPQSIAPLRGCADRCAAVWASMGPGAAGWRLWDAGCSLGYNTLYFVDRGLSGVGTDIDPRNIAICREIAPFTPGHSRFAQEALTCEAVAAIAPGSFDCAFFFSLLHHLIEAHGLAYVQDLMAAVLQRIPVIYAELALAEEISPPGYGWEAHLPEDPLSIFALCADLRIELIGHFPTHVCPVDRPLYRVARQG